MHVVCTPAVGGRSWRVSDRSRGKRHASQAGLRREPEQSSSVSQARFAWELQMEHGHVPQDEAVSEVRKSPSVATEGESGIAQ